MMMTGVSKSPLVERTRERLARELAKHRYAADKPLPTQREWAKKLGVSQFIIHRALELLKREGVVEARQGSYTFLKANPRKELAATRAVSASIPVILWQNDRKSLLKSRQAIARHRFQARFRRQRPSVIFEEPQIELGGSEAEALLVQSLLKGAEPTLGITTQTCLPFLREQRAIAAAPASIQPYTDALCPHYRSACGSHLLPTGVTRSFLVFNRTRFHKAGLDSKRPPRDWEELASVARALKAADHGRPGFHIAGASNVFWFLMQLAHQAADSMPATHGVMPRVDWTSAAARTGVEFFERLFFREQSLSLHLTQYKTLPARFLADEIPLMLVDTESVAQVVALGEAERFGIAPMPVGPNGRELSLLNCSGWFVNAHATEEQQDAAWQYALAWERWLHEDSGGAEMKRLGVLPPLTSLFTHSSKDRFVADRLPPSWLETLEQLDACGRWEGPDADWHKMALGQALKDLLAGDEPVSAEVMLRYLRQFEFSGGFSPGPDEAGAQSVIENQKENNQ